MDTIVKYHLQPTEYTSSKAKVTPIMILAGKDRFGDLLEAVIRAGADVYAGDANGWTPLMYAIANGNKEGVRVLLHYGSDENRLFNVYATNQDSPLSLAQRMGQADILTMIQQAKKTLTSSSKKTAPGKASPAGRKAVTSAAMVPNKHALDILAAVRENNLAGVRYFVNDGGDIHYVDNGGYTALIHAVALGHTDIAKFLVTSGAAVNSAENDGWTPLMFAAFQGKVETVDMLLDAGANPLQTNGDGFAAYTLAIGNGHKQVRHTAGLHAWCECVAV